MKTATLDAPAPAAITSTVGALSDRELLHLTSTLVRHERHLQGAVIDHLAEIEARRLFLQRGCSSLFDYAVRELGYSDAAAGRRIGAVRLCADQPDARERLRDGSLTLSAAAELQWAFDRQRRRESIFGTASPARAGSAPGNAAATEDQAAAVPAGLAPSGAAAPDGPAADGTPPRTSIPPASPPLVLDAAGRQKLMEDAAGKSARQVRRMLADLDPELTTPADRMRPLGDGRYELKALIDADCHKGLEQLRGLLSHVDPRMTIGQLVGRVVQEALDRHDPSRPPRRARSASRPADGDVKPAPASKEQATRERGHASTVQDAAVHAHTAPTAESTLGATRQPAPASASAPSPVQGVASPVGTTPTAEWTEEPTPQPSRQEATDRRGATRRKQTGAVTSTAKARASGRAIPAAVRRQVWQRDGGCCSYVDRETGRRCNSRHMIEIDHILPYALGGAADPGNLRLVCRAHHRHRHAPHGSRRTPER